jgi:hypothetical protein
MREAIHQEVSGESRYRRSGGTTHFGVLSGHGGLLFAIVSK